VDLNGAEFRAGSQRNFVVRIVKPAKQASSSCFPLIYGLNGTTLAATGSMTAGAGGFIFYRHLSGLSDLGISGDGDGTLPVETPYRSPGMYSIGRVSFKWRTASFESEQ